MTQWEYMWMSDARPLDTKAMDRLGAAGWELVSVVHVVNTCSLTQIGKQIAYFKRQLTKETK